MTRDEIKAAADRLADLERIETLKTDLKNGNVFTVTSGNVFVAIKEFDAPELRADLCGYLQALAETIEGKLPKDEFDEELAKLEADAKPLVQ